MHRTAFWIILALVLIGLVSAGVYFVLRARPILGIIAFAISILSLWLVVRRPLAGAGNESLAAGEIDTGFGGHIRRNLGAAQIGWQTFLSGIGKVGQDAAGLIYYWQWNSKAKLKRWLRTLSFAIVVFSSLILLLELAGEYFGASRLLFWLKSLPVSERVRLIMFLGSAVFLVVHYQSEIRKPEHEYEFITRLLTVMSRQRAEGDDGAALAIFHALFARAGINHVSVYRLTEDGQRLRIATVFPVERDLFYPEELPVGKGVAGRVYKDKAPRYAARLFFPIRFRHRKFCIYLPHAQRFVLEKDEEAPGRFVLHLIEKRVEAHVFETVDRTKLLFNSLLSVPILHPQTGESLGVLNFDFHKPGCLDAIDVTMASLFGRWFGVEEVEEVEKVE